ISDLCRLIWCALVGLFRSRVALEAEILVLRHQLNVLRRKSRKRVVLGGIDRLGACWAVSPGSGRAGRPEDRQAGDGDSLASCWFPGLLALEITTKRGPAEDAD